jgi:hypothetical protein
MSEAPLPQATEATNSIACWNAINSIDFQNRCKLLWNEACLAVTNEDQATASHNERLRYAGKILSGAVMPHVLSQLVVASSLIQIAIVADYAADRVVGHGVGDSDIEAQIDAVLTGAALADAAVPPPAPVI